MRARRSLRAIITAEHGKVLSDRARRGKPRPREVVEFACGIPQLDQGRLHRERLDEGRCALHAAAAWSNWHHLPVQLPAMVPMWFYPIALAAGKHRGAESRAKRCRPAALWVAELWKEAGLPDGVFNVLNGDKVAVDGLLTHPDVESISFVGSTPIAKVHLRDWDNPRQARASPLGAPRTTRWYCPTPTLILLRTRR
jgi:malonate-semialdehyde dehydrogenase (acetylating)/methylmalonate-semialdehyde dehydrogenase